MKKVVSFVAMLAIVAASLFGFNRVAQADEMKFVGRIKKIEFAGKGAKTAIVTLKDIKGGFLIVITVNNENTLAKFKAKPDPWIGEGDLIYCKYEIIGDKNVSKMFRKTAGHVPCCTHDAVIFEPIPKDW